MECASSVANALAAALPGNNQDPLPPFVRPVSSSRLLGRTGGAEGSRRLGDDDMGEAPRASAVLFV